MIRTFLYSLLFILPFMAAIQLGFPGRAEACTRVLWNNNDLMVAVGRSMDWPESTEPSITVLPRGMMRDGGVLGGHRIVKENPKVWTSKYGSMVVTVYGLGSADGFNEAGLGVHMLYFTQTDFGQRDPSIPGLQAGLWGQYLLDNAANVKEAIELMDGIQLIMAEARGRQATVHLAIEDASGDSAVLEYIEGRLVVHHGPQYRVMTNDPAYATQLELVGNLDFSNPASDLPIPGNVNPIDRFQRATYYLALLPEPPNARQAVAGILAVIRNVSVPFGAPYRGFGLYNTEYRTVMDLTNKMYFFELTNSPNLVWAQMDKFDLSPGAPVMSLDPDDINLSGNVNEAFAEWSDPPF